MAKVSKNARVAQRATGTANVSTGRDFVKVVKPIKNEKTGKYSYKEVMIHKDNVKEFFADVK